MASWDDLTEKQAAFVMHYVGSACYDHPEYRWGECDEKCKFRKIYSEKAAGYDRPQTDLLAPSSPTGEMIRDILQDRLPPQEAIHWELAKYLLHGNSSLNQKSQGASVYFEHASTSSGSVGDLSKAFGLDVDGEDD